MKNFIKMFLAACVVTVFAFGVQAQSVGINADGSAPNSSAGLDVNFTNKGFLPPRMTYAQKTAITSPAAGLMIWCTNCGTNGELQVYNGAAWTNLIGGAASGTVPGAPTIGTATAGNAQASVSFTAPASNGGSAITSYTATSNPGNITKTLSQAGSGTITVTGLTNGTAYTFTVTATNANGTGAASDPSNSVTPATVPGAPTGVSATAGNAQASVSFTAPASNGGSAITSYTATSTPGSFTGTLTQAGSGTITVTGLTNGTAYTFTIKATNAAGTGAASAASNSVTPATVPGAPTIGTATAGDGQASVTFTAPASNGGSAITLYTATSTPDDKTGTVSGPGDGTITVSELTNGTAYTFTVTATNANGISTASAASNSVTPVVPFICGQTFTDTRDGKDYTTVLINEQCWMAENLAYLPSVTDLATPASNTDPFYYVNGYDGTNVDDAKATANYQTYGALYNWPAAVAACATGWHLPNDAEWTTLTTFLGGADFAGTAMKEAGFAHWIEDPEGSPGTNSSGFTGLPGSYRSPWGTFQELGREGFFWSSTEESPTSARTRLLYNQYSMVGNNADTKAFGFSVRCVR